MASFSHSAELEILAVWAECAGLGGLWPEPTEDTTFRAEEIAMSRGLLANHLGSALLPRRKVVLGTGSRWSKWLHGRQPMTKVSNFNPCHFTLDRRLQEVGLVVPLQRAEFAHTLHGWTTTTAFRSRPLDTRLLARFRAPVQCHVADYSSSPRAVGGVELVCAGPLGSRK